MANDHSNKAQASSSTGFWETYDTESFSEYKKPNCEELVIEKKKKSNKKPKPSPALASLLFHSGEEANPKNKYASYEPHSGPNAWSTKSGAELFKEPPDETRSKNIQSTGRSGLFSPYYPESQDDFLDEEEQMRRAIEESMRSAAEEEKKKKLREKEEEEWLSQLCADLKKQDKSNDNAKMSSARQKVTRYSVSADSTDSDDFQAVSFRNVEHSKSLIEIGGGKVKSKKSEPIQKVTEKKQPDKQKEKKQTNSSQKTSQEKTDFNQKSNEIKQAEKLPEREVFQEIWDVRGEQQPVRNQKRFTKSVYDNYDDEPDEADYSTASNTYWPARNESHKWNAETWSADSLPGGRNNKIQRNSRHDMPDVRNEIPRAQFNKNFRADELPNTRNKSFDSRHEMPKPPRNRNFRQDEITESQFGQEYRKVKKDLNRNNINLHSKGTVISQGKLRDEINCSSGKNRNFKEDFISEEVADKVDDKKHVKFSSIQSTHVLSQSESETDSSSKTTVPDVFASSKIQFDESLYSNQYQKGKVVLGSRKSDTTRSSKPAVRQVGGRSEKPDSTKYYKPDTTNNDKPMASGAPRQNLSRNTWKESLQSSEDNERQPPTLSWMQQSRGESEKENEGSPVKLNQVEKKDGTSGSNQTLNDAEIENSIEPDDLGPSLSDNHLNDLANSVTEIHLNDLTPSLQPAAKPLDSLASMKASVLSEIKAEVKLPQDNQIYNFYLNKQLGRQNTQEHLVSQPGGQYYNLPPDPSPPQSSLDMFWAGLPKDTSAPASSNLTPIQSTSSVNSPFSPYPNSYSGYSLPPYPPRSSFDYYMPQSSVQQSSNPQPFQVPYIPAPTAQYPSVAPPGFYSNTVSASDPRSLRATSTPLSQVPSISLPFPHNEPLSDAFSFPSIPPKTDSLPPPPTLYDSQSISSQPSLSQPFSSQMPTLYNSQQLQMSSTYNNHLPQMSSTYNSQPPLMSSTCSRPLMPQTSSQSLSSQIFESNSLDDNAPWRIILAQAQNDLVMLHQISECLGKGIKECNDPEQLGTLINMMTEVNSAALHFSERQQAKTNVNFTDRQLVESNGNSSEKQDVNEDQSNVETHSSEVAGFTYVLPVEGDRAVSRGRGRRTEATRDHVLPSPGRRKDN